MSGSEILSAEKSAASASRWSSRILCVLNRHDPDRNHVTWGGHDFVGRCRGCGSRVRRKRHGVWRADHRPDPGES